MVPKKIFSDRPRIKSLARGVYSVDPPALVGDDERCNMKSLIIAAAVVPGTATAALADGPRASSQSNWPGMAQRVAAQESATAPHYVWQEGYDHHTVWRGQWVLFR